MLGQHLQGDGLAGAGRTGNQAVPVGHARQQEQLRLGFVAGFGDQQGFGHGRGGLMGLWSGGE